jgi:DNA-directed RNA polymerase specialized sigma24 family protein
MVPAIRRHARNAFRNLHGEALDEAIAETVANAMVAYRRLHERGKADSAYPTVLARYAVAQIRSGRRVGTPQNTRDVMTLEARKRGGFTVGTLHRFDGDAGEWLEATIEDTSTPVPDQAAFRCDFPEWLRSLSRRNRRIAEALSLGHSTSEVARRFHVSSGRVSQLRRELNASWLEFHGEGDEEETPTNGD